MGDDRVTFYFAYNSPYAFLANTRIDDALAPLGVPLDRTPVYQPSTGGGPDFNSPRIQYIVQDIARFRVVAHEAEINGLEVMFTRLVDESQD